jgi:hypothetical protein
MKNSLSLSLSLSLSFSCPLSHCISAILGLNDHAVTRSWSGVPTGISMLNWGGLRIEDITTFSSPRFLRTLHPIGHKRSMYKMAFIKPQESLFTTIPQNRSLTLIYQN